MDERVDPTRPNSASMLTMLVPNAGADPARTAVAGAYFVRRALNSSKAIASHQNIFRKELTGSTVIA
jgi:hypothetical protein